MAATWLVAAPGRRNTVRCGRSLNAFAARPTAVPSRTNRRASDSAATHSPSTRSSSQVSIHHGSDIVCMSSAIRTSRSRPGSYRRLTGRPTRAVAFQWIRRTWSPGW